MELLFLLLQLFLEILRPVLVILAIGGIFMLLQVGVACWEQRYIWPYSALSPTSPTGEGYATFADRWAADAQKEGFTLLGWATDTRGEKYQIRTAFLVSPDRTSLAVISTGKVIGIVVKGAMVTTLSDDLRSYYTTDNLALAEFDITRKAVGQVLKVSNFAELWQEHQTWIQCNGIRAALLERGRELEQHQGHRDGKLGLLAEKKWIAFLNSERTIWRYTLVGAVIFAVGGYVVNTLRSFTGNKFPRVA